VVHTVVDPSLPDIQPGSDEDAAWRAFVADLANHLAACWPAMPERLGERYPAFVERAVQQALGLGIGRAAAVARLVNLGFVWGPAFHERPEHAWAPPLLALAAQSPQSPPAAWLALHQLVQRSLLELQRLPGSRITPQALADADADLIDRYGALGYHGALQPADPLPAPRAACDLEAADLRLVDEGWLAQAVLGGTAPDGTAPDWQRQTGAWPAPLRVDAGRPLPLQIAALSHPRGQGPQARLQVKLRPLCVCDGDRHPRLDFGGPHGRWTWAGHAGKSASWLLATREQPLPRAGAGAIVAEETSPELHRLDIDLCGLRDSGPALGAQRCTVAVWPATQWWLQWQRSPAPPQALLPGPRPWQRGSTLCRVERDGRPLDSAALRQQFEAGLDAAIAAGLQALAGAWAAVPGIAAAQLEGTLGLLTGQASLAWGWALDGAGGLGVPALMRVVGQLAIDAAQVDLQLSGEWGADPDAGDALAGTRTRIQLRLAGHARLQQRLLRETAATPLAALLGGAVARWRWPVQLQVAPLAAPSGRLAQALALAPTTGALVGEAGLRPCTSGSSGWEWFAALRLEPVTASLASHDPLLGTQTQTLALLPALTLVDWRLG
jgi:hypothetical protein